MTARSRERALGLGLMAFALLLVFHAVPEYVVRPRAVRNIVLAPQFWPLILSWLLLLTGGLLTARTFLQEIPEEPGDEGGETGRAGLVRLAGLGVVLVGLSVLVPWAGMVWAGMAAFLAIGVITRPARPLLSVAVAVLLPLALYFFFSKFAGVPIPQGEFVRLP